MKPHKCWAIACNDGGRLSLVGIRELVNPELYATREDARKEIKAWTDNFLYGFHARPVRVEIRVAK